MTGTVHRPMELTVTSEGEKQALVQEPSSPWFTTPHFDGHSSVLVRASRLGELDREELIEVLQEAWLARASTRRAAAWLRSAGLPRLSAGDRSYR